MIRTREQRFLQEQCTIVSEVRGHRCKTVVQRELLGFKYPLIQPLLPHQRRQRLGLNTVSQTDGDTGRREGDRKGTGRRSNGGVVGPDHI